MTRLTDLKQALDERVEILKKSLADLDGETPNAESVHRLRVASRKLRALIWVFNHGTKVQPKQKIKKRLKVFGDVLGQRRQIDVLKKDAEKYHLKPKPGVFAAATKEADEVLEHYFDTNKRRKLRRSLKELQKVADEVDALALEKLSKDLKKVFAGWEKNPPTTLSDFHRLRIDVKKARYVMDACGLKTSQLEALQNALGKVHDLQVLTDYFDINDKVRRESEKYLEKATALFPLCLKQVNGQLARMQNPATYVVH